MLVYVAVGGKLLHFDRNDVLATKHVHAITSQAWKSELQIEKGVVREWRRGLTAMAGFDTV